jgi:hypothetical protein
MGTETPFLGVNSSGKINSTEELRRCFTPPQICLVSPPPPVLLELGMK